VPLEFAKTQTLFYFETNPFCIVSGY